MAERHTAAYQTQRNISEYRKATEAALGIKDEAQPVEEHKVVKPVRRSKGVTK